MDNFTFLEGIEVSLFSIVVVFFVLFVLSLIITLFSKVLIKFDKTSKTEEPAMAPSFDDDHEEKLVAQIVASCLLQKDETSNVRIKSIVRVK